MKAFNINNKPVPPIKPKEFWEEFQITKSATFDEYMPLSDILDLSKHFDPAKSYIRVDPNTYDGLELVEKVKKKVPHPYYKINIKRYEKELAKYEEDIKWWEEQKVIYLQKEEEKKEREEKKIFEKLKKKYGN